MLSAAAAVLWWRIPTDEVATYGVVPAALLIVAWGLARALASGAYDLHWPHPRRRRHLDH